METRRLTSIDYAALLVKSRDVLPPLPPHTVLTQRPMITAPRREKTE